MDCDPSRNFFVRFSGQVPMIGKKMEMSDASDSELLAAWVEQHREPAFHALVARYATLVHMAAKRTCGDDDSLAADASQLVFILLAQKAKSLIKHPTLAGWLHVTAVNKTRDLIDKASRESRKRRLLSSAMETRSANSADDAWQEIQPVLDDALASLTANDREALLLRFYRSLTVREIAATLGIATDAAQKRIDRATERLRGKLARRGVQAGGSLGAAMLTGFAADAQAAALPVSLLTSKALAGSAGLLSTQSTLGTILLMKLTAFAPPAIVLVIAGAWIASQRQTIHALDRQSVSLEAAVANRASTDSVTRDDIPASVQASAASAKEAKLDWNDIAERLANSDFTDIDQLKFDLRIQSLSQEEMLAAMDEIALLSVPEKIRDRLEYMVVFPFSKRFPEFMVKNLTARELGGTSAMYLDGAFETWAMKDSANAQAWLDAQVSAGTFESKTLDGKNWLWIQYEGGLLRSRLLQDGDALETRLDQLPAEMHKDVLHALGTAWKPMGAFEPGEEEAFCKLVRKHLSVADQAELFTIRARQVESGGFPAVDKFLTTIEATPDERLRCVRAVAISNISGIAINGTVRREDIVALRDWLRTQTPQDVDRFTGEALGDAAGHKGIAPTNHRKLGYPEAAAFAVEFSEASGSDALLVSFLKSEGGRSDKNQSRLLAARIADESLRAEILDSLK
jgi:RNA polymerase sigma factor (sigma-70 family)